MKGNSWAYIQTKKECLKVKKRMINWTTLKLKTSVKDNIKRIREISCWAKILAKDTSEKEFLSKIY